MPCFKPLSAWSYYSSETGKRAIAFGRHEHVDTAKTLDLPCGQCIGCRLERSRRWAVRLMHEATLHEENSFLTLTYDEDHVPSDGSLNVKHFQDFMKRLRKRSGAPLRFFHCGEYGERRGRPHYHCILFGEAFRADRQEIEPTQTGLPQYESEALTETWGMGRCTIGEVTFESAAYVARYALKKITGDKADDHYHGRKPEYVTMSRRPGIGKGWVDRWGFKNIYDADHVVMRGKEMLPPPFYDKLLEKADPRLFEKVKRARAATAKDLAFSQETTSPRLMVREEVQRQTISKSLKRGIE